MVALLVVWAFLRPESIGEPCDAEWSEVWTTLHCRKISWSKQFFSKCNFYKERNSSNFQTFSMQTIGFYLTIILVQVSDLSAEKSQHINVMEKPASTILLPRILYLCPKSHFFHDLRKEKSHKQHCLDMLPVWQSPQDLLKFPWASEVLSIAFLPIWLLLQSSLIESWSFCSWSFLFHVFFFWGGGHEKG